MIRPARRTIGVALTALFVAVCIPLIGGPALADPEPGQSAEVVIIGGTFLDTGVPCGIEYDAANTMGHSGGGCLPVTGGAGELGDFAFYAMHPSDVSAANLAPYDTAVLNMATTDMACDANNLTPQAKTDLVEFVEGGKKLIIFDSECYPGPVDYSWMPFPFETANPGAMGAQGTLTIVEENKLSSTDPTDPHYIDAYHLGNNTDAVGDMNVMTTYDPNWCLDMSGTNILPVTGPVHTYAKYPAGMDAGLIIYNGLDQDYLYDDDPWLRKMWVQELQQPFNPTNLPCGVTVVGITLEPLYAENMIGEDHTVTAMLTDLFGDPQPDIEVTFEVLSGPNAGAAGVCSANADCTTDANGQVSFTYTGSGGVGTDEIEACFINGDGDEVCSQVAVKEWVSPSEVEVYVDIKPMSCPNPFNLVARGVVPVAVLGTEEFDVTTIDPATIQLTREGYGGVSPLRWAYWDVATPFEGELCDCQDLHSDGYQDLVLFFRILEVRITLDLDDERGNTIPLTATGSLFEDEGGTPIEGSDCIWVLPRY